MMSPRDFDNMFVVIIGIGVIVGMALMGVIILVLR